MNVLGILAVYQFTVKAIIESNSITHTYWSANTHTLQPTVKLGTMSKP